MSEAFTDQDSEALDNIIECIVELTVGEAGCREFRGCLTGVADVLEIEDVSPYAMGNGIYMPARQRRVMTSCSWPAQRSWRRCLLYVAIRSTVRRSWFLRNCRPALYRTSFTNVDDR